MNGIQPIPATLWNEFTQGDQAAFTRLYHLYFNDLFSYGMHLCRNKALVKECIQDLFVKLWHNRQQLPPVAAVQYYLIRALRNTLLTRISSGTKIIFDELEERHYDFEISYPIEQQLIRDEQQKLLYGHFRVAVKKLTPRQKEIIYLRYIKQVPYEEVSVIMDISVKAAYKLIARALETLRENLQHIYLH